MSVFKKFFFLNLFYSFAIGNNTFDVSEKSQQYNIKMNLGECNDEESHCSGVGFVSFSHKSGVLFQEIKLSNIEANLNRLVFNPLSNSKVRSENGSGYSLILDDFNFDGIEDVAIWSGNMAGYGGPSYHVYLYEKSRNKFKFSKAFSRLTVDSLGLFQVLNKQIITYSKDGCCNHGTQKFELENDQLLLVESIEETLGANGIKTFKSRKLKSGKWFFTTKRFKSKD